ncbi:Uncharacterised protein [Mycobacterium tuberculosis]|nr:Uncharacterised protein [Mycobacterium tuberculosis]
MVHNDGKRIIDREDLLLRRQGNKCSSKITSNSKKISCLIIEGNKKRTVDYRNSMMKGDKAKFCLMLFLYRSFQLHFFYFRRK